MSFRVLISDALPEEGAELLRASGQIEVIVETKDYAQHIPEVDGWIIRSATTIGPDQFAEAKRLKCVCRAGTGVDNIDLTAATQHDVVVMNTPDSNSMAAAEHAVALLVSLARNIPFAHHTMAGDGWDKKKFVGVEYEGKTAGVIGLGKVGRIAARKLKGLGMKVVGVDPVLTASDAEEHGIELLSLDEMLARADFITLHTPLNDGTRNMLSTAQFAAMKPGVRIVNCSRGGVVDEEALFAAVESGQVAGAALDVFAEEPTPVPSSLRNHPRIVTTPHLGASTVEAQLKVATVSAAQIRDCLLEGKVSNQVN